jgi:hypothetical protein
MRATFLGALAMGALLTVTTANGEVLHFRARLSPPSASAPGQHGAAGLAEATLDTDSRLLSWKVTYSGLSGPLTGAHFRAPSEPGSLLGAQLDLAPRLTNPMVASALLNDAQIGDLRAGLWSVSLLTSKRPQGEIGGDLERAP